MGQPVVSEGADRISCPLPISLLCETLLMMIQLTKDFLGNAAGQRLDIPEADATNLVQQGYAQSIDDDPIVPLVQRSLQPALEQSLEKALTKALAKSAPGRA